MPDYRHLLRMTDDRGILQFSKYNTPDPLSGYTLDDNARALMIALSKTDGYELAYKYALWLYKAQRPDGRWSNFELGGMYYSRFDSEDSIGRALLACSMGSQSFWPKIKQMCTTMFNNNLPNTLNFRSPRAIAYTLLALCKNPDSDTKENQSEIMLRLAEYLISLYQIKHTRRFMWFEDYLTYCNGIIPQALFAFYTVTGDKKALKIAHDSLNFLNSLLFRNSYLNIIGNQGWYQKGSKVPLFDQQPVDAASIAFACFEAYHTIGEIEYLELAILAHKWYRGHNIHNVSLYNTETGGCYDALTAEGVNQNQGAEAVLSLLLTDTLMLNFVSQEIDIDKTS